MPRVEPDPFSLSEATGALPDPFCEPPELKPLHASLKALASEGEPAAEPEPAGLPFAALELANTGWPSSVTTPAVPPLSRAANCSPATALPVPVPDGLVLPPVAG